MTEQEMQKIAEMVAIKLKGDEKEMTMPLKEMLQLIEKRDDFFSDIENKTYEKFVEKLMEFNKLLDIETKELLNIIDYKCEKMTLHFKIEDKEIDIKFKNNFEDLVESYEKTGRSMYDIKKYSINNYEKILSNFKILENSIYYGFENHNNDSIETILKKYLTGEIKL